MLIYLAAQGCSGDCSGSAVLFWWSPDVWSLYWSVWLHILNTRTNTLRGTGRARSLL